MNVVRDFFSIQESVVRPHGFGNFCDGPHGTKNTYLISRILFLTLFECFDSVKLNQDY